MGGGWPRPVLVVGVWARLVWGVWGVGGVGGRGACVLAPLPRAILGATVIGAVLSLLDPRATLAIWGRSKPQSMIAWITFGATLASAPHVEQGVLIGIGVAIGVHLWREMSMEVPVEFDGSVLRLRPVGVLWFGTAAKLEQALTDAVAAHGNAHRVVIDLSGLGRVDYSGALTLERVVSGTHGDDLQIEVTGVPLHAQRIIE